MRRYLLMMAVVIALVATACGGSDSAESLTADSVASESSQEDAAATDDAGSTDSETASEPEISAEDAAIMAQYPIPVVAGGRVVLSYDDGTGTQLNLSYPPEMIEQLLTFYGIWAQGTITESQVAEGSEIEGFWQGLDAEGALIRIRVQEGDGLDGNPGAFADLFFQP